MNWYVQALKKYLDFGGRARRKEYWMFVLFNILITVILGILAALINVPIISVIYSLAIIIPSLAVTVRRLHDIDKSGFWIFIDFVPIIGGIWLLILLCTEGSSVANQYGVDPKMAD